MPQLKTDNNSLLKNSPLNFDILPKIFEHFFVCSQTEDIKIAHTLFSCALVNKQWCKLALPLLWRDPFRFTLTARKGSKDNAGEMVSTLLSCLTKKECQQFSSIIKKLIPKLSYIPPICRRHPFFNYPNFIKNLHTKGLINSALNWFENTFNINSLNITTSYSTGSLKSITSLNGSNSSLNLNNDPSNSDNNNTWDKNEKRIFVEQVIQCLLQMLVERDNHFKTVYVEKVEGNDKFSFTRCFFKEQFVKTFNQIQKLDIHEMEITGYPDMLNVWKDFSNLTSLSITMQCPTDNYSNLSQILQSTNTTKHLRKLKLHSGETKYILPLLSSKYSSSIQHLIFEKIQLDTTDDWHLLSNFTKLSKMKFIHCWINQIDNKQQIFSIITQTPMQFNNLKLFVWVDNEGSGLSIEDDAKSELVLWGIQQHAIVALENLCLENARIYHESIINGLLVNPVKHHRYASYTREIKRSLKIKS
ncbi:7302_t:CDS:2 [Funneliformis geosporum]|uniref:8115_t:CDS:1 n=1 Tax=Funneliformis geosporum TaxID=1117311 RepID=A0A9W4SZ40_9GLOM|nr:7302_t:CDS:2 [Funneliformis geosporum]CAI2186774.1 8115_t:CDS:2 [Funneliformis geosporum]